MQQVLDQLPQGTGILSQAEIGNGLKEALNNGITKQVSKLTATDGFFKNEAVKILLPQELQVVDKKLRQIGMSKLADEGLKVLNRAAEDAVKEAALAHEAVLRHVEGEPKKIIYIPGKLVSIVVKNIEPNT